MHKIIGPFLTAILIAFLCACGMSPTTISNSLPENTVTVIDNTPPGCPFTYDFQMPEYDGIGDLQFINNQWLLIVNEYAQAARERAVDIVAQSEAGQELLPMKAIWDRWSWWKKYSRLLRPAFLEAYTEYLQMGEPEFFTISSQDDPDYSSPKHPVKALRWHQQTGAHMEYRYARDREVMTPTFGAYAYLKMPTPLRNGMLYTIEQTDGRKVSFTWDSHSCVSRLLKVNQNGYAADVRKKLAYLGLWIPGLGPLDLSKILPETFSIIPVGETEPVFKGTIEFKTNDPQFIKKGKPAGHICGEQLYQLDFSELKATGQFYIMIDGIGRSWPFYHTTNAYGRAFYLAMRGMYQQRSGCELTSQFTAWTRNACFTNAGDAAMIPFTPYMRVGTNAIKKLPVKEFEAIRRTGVFPSPTGLTGLGGWHDAADFDRRWFHYQSIWDLLFAYELAPGKFTDNQLHIPESGNGIPDLLDEAEWGLLVWRNTQRKNGGVSGRVEQTRHTPWPEFGMPDQDPYHMYVSLPTREFSLRYAASAAQLARLLKPFDAKRAADWLASAEKAYTYGNNPANALHIADYAETGESVTEEESWNYRSACLAGIQMYLATGNTNQLANGLEHFEYTLHHMGYPFRCFMHLLPYALTDDPAIPAEIKGKARKWYLDRAEKYYAYLAEQPYPYSLPLDWPWGYAWGNGTMSNYSRWLLIGYYLSGCIEQKYLDGAAQNADFVLGCNPLGISWMSGCGYNYPTVFFDCESEMDGIEDPVPGIVIYGPTGGIGMGARRHGYFYLNNFKNLTETDRAFCPPPFDTLDGIGGIPVWRRWSPDFHSDPALQEFTIWETMSPSCFAFGLLMGEGWTPDNTLKEMKPRPSEFLFGNYLTP